ncbi:hypothetical protein CFC21_032862 [Triticum aestivum]|uniref:Malectin-like domain-containing protein n=2 Tax=Triticum aestivum TaxID=4565 RepID=A0A9R1F073_WHEAT|nr:hypothetical protein CFC21_032862 [Triticum aestivum]
MVARWWLLLLGLAADVLQVGGQRAPDTTGFISIDCGLSEQSSYVDDLTKLLLSSDAGFTDAGTNYDVSARYTNLLYRRFLTVRSFPSSVDGRSCYTLPSAVPGTSKYMVRAAFKYGDYDGLNKLPIFDLYLGVNLWRTVNITDAGLVQIAEAIVVIPEDRVQVCMVNIGSGTPFISTLDLRPLKNSLYPQANATQGLSMIFTGNFGASDVIRYPNDPYDRLWVPWWSVVLWSGVFGHGNFQGDQDGKFEVPAVVMKTAITPFNPSDNISCSSQARRFNVGYNNHLSMSNYEPSYLKLGYNNIEPVQFFNQYNVTISRAPNSTLPPIINACEFFSTMSTANVGTNAHDDLPFSPVLLLLLQTQCLSASAMIAIKAKYQVKKNWEGDPCSPKTLVWHGLNCSYPISLPPRITSVNMSFGGLGGDISSYFAKLKAIQYLDLSHNELTGFIPNELSQLHSLVVL